MMRDLMNLLKESHLTETASIDEDFIAKVVGTLINERYPHEEVTLVREALEARLQPRPQSRDYAKGYHDALSGKAFDPPTNGDRSEYERGWKFVRQNRRR